MSLRGSLRSSVGVLAHDFFLITARREDRGVLFLPWGKRSEVVRGRFERGEVRGCGGRIRGRGQAAACTSAVRGFARAREKEFADFVRTLCVRGSLRSSECSLSFDCL